MLGVFAEFETNLRTSTAILYGDPSKAGVYVTRTKFPAGFKLMPPTHPDEVS